jgi:ABC-2 type transport system ATP-binding protein
VRSAIGYVAQDSGVDWEATGRENLLLQGRIHGMSGAPLHARVDELLELVGLREAADRIARGYSGGMKRRLDIAIGLVHRPRVLFLDEPTTGLDPEARAAMWLEVERLAEHESLTILLTTHYLEEADRLAERVAIVSRGKVVVEGTPDELKAGLAGELVTVELGDVNGRVAEAEELVRTLDDASEVAAEGRVIRTRVPNGAQAIPAILARLDAAGFPVAAVTTSRPSLDDVYLHYTGRDFASEDTEGQK